MDNLYAKNSVNMKKELKRHSSRNYTPATMWKPLASLTHCTHSPKLPFVKLLLSAQYLLQFRQKLANWIFYKD